jgi:predicted ATPase/transcriptional regulator with XRE-family HTH domain
MSGDVSFGRWLSARRHLLDLTQEALARQVGCAVVTIRKLEADERRPSRQLAERLAVCLALPSEEWAAFVRLARFDPLAPGVPVPPLLQQAPDRTLHAESLATAVTPLTRLIGRDTELAAICARLTDTGVRLLTLIGTPGIGKTRLALSVAANVAASFPDGVAFVDLSPIGSPQLVLPTIAKVVGVQEQGDRAITLLLHAYLRTRHMLLLLDNFEQVVDAAPALAELLIACPGVTALVTSRAALHVRGEHLHPVAPLSIPDLAALPSTDLLATVPSVELFVERARAVVLDFALTDLNAPVVAAICARLDGLPLAIELIAARVPLLPPAALLARLTSRLDLLSTNARDIPPRHRTLRLAITWSYNLLSVGEQALFRRLSIFVGGCTLEAVEAVCVLPEDMANAPSELTDAVGTAARVIPDTLATVTALVHQSLLRQEVSADGEVRLTMLATIHEYAREQLVAAGEHTLLAWRHADYYRNLASLGEAGIRGREQVQWLDQLTREHDNLRSAFDWYHTQPDGASRELELVASLWTFFVLRCHYTEGRAAIDLALARRNPADSPCRAYALALVGAGFLMEFQGHFAEAKAIGEASAAAWREMGDDWGLALALNIVGGAYDELGDEQRGVALHEESLALARAVGEPWCLGLALGNLAVTRVVERDEARARSLLEEALALGERAQIPYLCAMSSWNLGNWDQFRGDYDAAQARLTAGLAIHQQLGDRGQAARIVGCLADIARERGEYTQAAMQYAACLAVIEELGDVRVGAYFRCRLGYLALATQEPDQAAARFRESLALIAAQEFRLGASLCLLGVAKVASERGRWERSAKLLGAAAAVRERLSERLGPIDQGFHDELVTAAREHLSHTAWSANWDTGHSMPEEEAFCMALKEVSSYDLLLAHHHREQGCQ